MPLFSRTRQLENQIDEFLDLLSESAIVFELAIAAYLADGACQAFLKRVVQVGEMESGADELRRQILMELYTQTLLPDSREDVLRLLLSLDKVINRIQALLHYFRVERPDIPPGFDEGFRELAGTSKAGVEALALSSRAFFRDTRALTDHVHKVQFYEHEADLQVSKLLEDIFDSELPLERKTHLRFFAERIGWLTDKAEDISDDLRIYAIKRAL